MDSVQDRKFNCGNCGAEISANDEQCPNCGIAFLEDDIYACYQCGCEVSLSDKVCSNCNAQLILEELQLNNFSDVVGINEDVSKLDIYESKVHNFCKICGDLTVSNSGICDKCTKKEEHCTKCNKTVNDDDFSCPSCGVWLPLNSSSRIYNYMCVNNFIFKNVSDKKLISKLINNGLSILNGDNVKITGLLGKIVLLKKNLQDFLGVVLVTDKHFIISSNSFLIKIPFDFLNFNYVDNNTVSVFDGVTSSLFYLECNANNYYFDNFYKLIRNFLDDLNKKKEEQIIDDLIKQIPGLIKKDIKNILREFNMDLFKDIYFKSNSFEFDDLIQPCVEKLVDKYPFEFGNNYKQMVNVYKRYVKFVIDDISDDMIELYSEIYSSLSTSAEINLLELELKYDINEELINDYIKKINQFLLKEKSILDLKKIELERLKAVERDRIDKIKKNNLMNDTAEKILLECDGNIFVAIKEFMKQFNVDIDVAKKYINDAYHKMIN